MKLAIVLLFALGCSAAVPSVTLYNAAADGQTMPYVGLGTGGYNSDPTIGYNNYPECWDADSGCGAWVIEAVTKWLSDDVGGRRLDLADSYHNDKVVGQALAQANVNRSELFILEKVGPSLPLGYNDTLKQFAQILSDLQTDYVDMLLIHWPVQNPSQGNVSNNETESSDPLCNQQLDSYDPKACRLSTWKAMVELYESGAAKAIGVSNYNISHLEEIAEAGMPLPSLNQCPFHLYHSVVQIDLLIYCQKNNIQFLGYSPLGVPDWHKFTPPPATELQDPIVLSLAAKYDVTPAQVLLNFQWQLGVPVNPRSMNATHMKENLNYFDFELAEEDVTDLLQSHQITCAEDSWYECYNATAVAQYVKSRYAAKKAMKL